MFRRRISSGSRAIRHACALRSLPGDFLRARGRIPAIIQVSFSPFRVPVFPSRADALDSRPFSPYHLARPRCSPVSTRYSIVRERASDGYYDDAAHRGSVSVRIFPIFRITPRAAGGTLLAEPEPRIHTVYRTHSRSSLARSPNPFHLVPCIPITPTRSNVKSSFAYTLDIFTKIIFIKLNNFLMIFEAVFAEYFV